MDKKPHYQGHRQRLKEKFDEAPSVLADYEILELMLGYCIPRKDVKPIAKEMLMQAGTIGNIFHINCQNTAGAGKETERFLRIAAEFYNRIENSFFETKQTLSNPEQIYRLLKYHIGYAENENFAVILLNSKGNLIDKKIMTEGVVNNAIVYPRQIAEDALKNKAVRVIIAHNHPSGDSSPSKKDVELTHIIAESLSTLGIKLRDHIIVCKNEYSSLYDLGYMEE